MLDAGARLGNVRWLYPRPVSTAAVAAVAGLSVFVGRSLLPLRWCPTNRAWVLVAIPGTFAVLRLADQSGWAKQFKHSVLDVLGGDVDDAQTWFVGLLGAMVVLVSAKRLEQAVDALGQLRSQ